MTESKNPGGRPPYQPTEKSKGVVESAVAFGKTQEDIAAYLRIDRKTLAKHFVNELGDGKFKAHLKVGNMLFWLATECPDFSVRFRAGAFYAARQMGWKETTAQEVKVDAELTINEGLSAREFVLGRIDSIAARLDADEDPNRTIQ